MKTYVEFYFPGISVSGKCEREVSSRNVGELERIPEYAVSLRFFDKDEAENKVNYSPYYFLGKEYSAQEFKVKYPQLISCEELTNAARVVKSAVGDFYPLKDTDIVVAV